MSLEADHQSPWATSRCLAQHSPPTPAPDSLSVSSHRPPLPPLPPVSMVGFKGGASLTEHLCFCSVGLVCLGGDGLPACPPPVPPPGLSWAWLERRASCLAVPPLLVSCCSLSSVCVVLLGFCGHSAASGLEGTEEASARAAKGGPHSAVLTQTALRARVVRGSWGAGGSGWVALEQKGADLGRRCGLVGFSSRGGAEDGLEDPGSNWGAEAQVTQERKRAPRSDHLGLLSPLCHGAPGTDPGGLHYGLPRLNMPVCFRGVRSSC